MAKFVTKDPPEFSTEMRMLETNDPGHANVFNPLLAQLLNNDAFLKLAAEKLAQKIADHIDDETSHVTDQNKKTWNAKAGTEAATPSTAGLMSAADKTKLNGIDSGAQKITQVDNWRQGTDLPSTYPKGESIFFSNSPANRFNGIQYCTVHTIKGYSAAPCIQFLYPYNTNADKIYFREAILGSDAWRPWCEVITSANIGSQSVSHATTAGSATTATTATKAIQDGNGRNIVNTYASKSQYNNNKIAFNDNASITGDYSCSLGINAIASGSYSIASGFACSESGSKNFVTGVVSEVKGEGNIAVGYYTKIDGDWCIAIGWKSEAHCKNAGCSVGYYTRAYGNYGHFAEGNGSIASSKDNVLPIVEISGAVTTLTINQDIGLDYINTSFAKLKVGDEIVLVDAYYANIQCYERTITSINAANKSITITPSTSTDSKIVAIITPYTESDNKYEPSHAGGSACMAVARNSHAEGSRTIAGGNCSYAIGRGTVSNEYVQFIMGKYNRVINKDIDNSQEGGNYFLIGNGANSNNRSNCFRITSGGTVYANAAYNTGGADYAEMFEWLDSNPNGEDRVGYFVTLDGDKVRIASSQDYILGIVSGAPSVIGNSPEDWAGRWKKDALGRLIRKEVQVPVTETEEITEPILDEDGNETGEYEHKIREIEMGEFRTEMQLEQVEGYDPMAIYIERKDRPEWAAIGMLGVLAVYDDGSCQVNGYCKVADGGIATAVDSEYMLVEGKILRGYRVIERVAENIIKVVFR